ncbi:MAG: carboxypeptidase regulatory-like domain-containing protein [Candidatus Krumholzibacteria bacterium]|nr:carboxypeptidase regulatory-like domain-containing protein [Candidatus Krumholzibacteria bacterium]
MKRIFSCLMVLAIMTTMINYVAGCGGSDDPAAPPPPPGPGILKIVVRSSADNSLVLNSNVVLYQAENSEAVLRDLTDPDGTVYFSVDEGNYYLNTSAQGFNSAPVEGITPIPFFVALEDTLEKEIFLNVLGDTGSGGYVLGFVDPAINNFLILAESQSTQKNYSTISGPDGFFILFNLPYDTYDLDALKAGYMMDAPVDAFISSEAEVDTVNIPVSEYQGSVLMGSVTFLAIENSTVDITLLDPGTRAVIPGLSVMNDSTGLDYRIESIPDGSYLAWASLQNDGYVIDPDWLFKNPGGLDISFMTSSTLDLNFSVTGSITLVSPTNPANVTTAFMAESQVPVFRWLSYPSTKEYFIEVKDFSGNVLWGGLNGDGTVNHAFIGADVDSVIYNFDAQSGIPALQPGKIYQWRLWADKGTQADSFVEQLISSSEDLRGIFQVPENTSQ